jgi:hypothetical protein
MVGTNNKLIGEPKIIGQGKTVPALLGQNVTINCIAGGSPTPHVIWKMGGAALGNITGKREVNEIIHVQAYSYFS